MVPSRVGARWRRGWDRVNAGGAGFGSALAGGLASRDASRAGLCSHGLSPVVGPGSRARRYGRPARPGSRRPPTVMGIRRGGTTPQEWDSPDRQDGPLGRICSADAFVVVYPVSIDVRENATATDANLMQC